MAAIIRWVVRRYKRALLGRGAPSRHRHREKLVVVACSKCGSPRNQPHVCTFCGGE